MSRPLRPYQSRRRNTDTRRNNPPIKGQMLSKVSLPVFPNSKPLPFRVWDRTGRKTSDLFPSSPLNYRGFLSESKFVNPPRARPGGESPPFPRNKGARHWPTVIRATTKIGSVRPRRKWGPYPMVNGRLGWEALPGWKLDGDCYLVDATFQYDPGINPAISPLAPYTRMDLGTTLKVDGQLTVGLWGMDLEGAHTETIQTFGIAPTQVVPRVYGQLNIVY